MPRCCGSATADGAAAAAADDDAGRRRRRCGDEDGEALVRWLPCARNVPGGCWVGWAKGPCARCGESARDDSTSLTDAAGGAAAAAVAAMVLGSDATRCRSRICCNILWYEDTRCVAPAAVGMAAAAELSDSTLANADCDDCADAADDAGRDSKGGAATSTGAASTFVVAGGDPCCCCCSRVTS